MKNIEIHVNQQMPEKRTQVQADVGSPTSHAPAKIGASSRVVQAAGLAIAKKAVTDYSSRIGDRTGQRARQQNITNTMNVVGTVTNLLIGAKVGGVIGFGVAAAYTGYSALTTHTDVMRQRAQEEQRRDYYRSYAIMANRGRAGGMS